MGILNKYKNIVLILALFIGLGTKLFAQDVQFSQLFADKLYLNPAYAGNDYCPRIMVAHRNQWAGAGFPYMTYSASFDQYSEALHGGYGIRIMKDDQGGVFKMLSADFMYAHKVKLNANSSLSLAFQASVYQRSVNANELVFANMIDPRYGIIYPSSENINIQPIITPDFSAAVLYTYKNYFAGINVSHIPHSIVPEHAAILPMKIVAHAGAALPIVKNGAQKAKYVFEPNIVFIKQQNFNMLYYGTYFDISNVALGMFIRQDLKMNFDAMILSFHLDVKQFKIGYSYDVTLSRFLKHSMGTHEISLIYLFPCRKKIKDYGTISCPNL